MQVDDNKSVAILAQESAAAFEHPAFQAFPGQPSSKLARMSLSKVLDQVQELVRKEQEANAAAFTAAMGETYAEMEDEESQPDKESQPAEESQQNEEAPCTQKCKPPPPKAKAKAKCLLVEPPAKKSKDSRTSC